MSAIQRSDKTATLWVVTAVIVVGMLVGALVPGVTMLLIVVQVGVARLHGSRRLATVEPNRATASDLQGVLLYAATTISFFAKFFTGGHTTVTDATGVTWHTADIYETSVLVTVYGMFFIALLALLRIAHRHTTPAAAR